MKFSSLILLIFSVITLSCLPKNKIDKVAVYKNEILETEEAFMAMVADAGIKKAFLFYAADDAVLLRSNQLYLGKQSIGNLLSREEIEQEISLVWEVEFIDVSRSGDLGYTYGEYVYNSIDKKGAVNREKGIFHTIWKRQEDGQWRFVWD